MSAHEFHSMAEFAAHLAHIEVTTVLALHEGLKKVAEVVEDTARAEIGVYQPGVGSFPAWAELADSTKKERERLGFTPNDPLLRTGELRDSIGHEIEALEAIVGSTSDIMVYQELGTKSIPPRPVLGPAVLRNEKTIEKILGVATVTGLLGGKQMAASLGYNFETD